MKVSEITVLFYVDILQLKVCACVRVYVCVREKERDREREEINEFFNPKLFLHIKFCRNT